MLWSPFDPSHIGNPYPMYERLRKEDPVHRSQTGEFIITRYTDVKHALKSSDFRSGNRLEWLAHGIEYFKNHDEDLGNIYKAVNSFILFMNPPDHMAIRNFVMKTWDDREIDSMITDVVERQLQKLSGSFDVVKDFAQPVPAMVICEILGVPADEFEYLRALGVKMVRALDLYHSMKELLELNEASGQFVKYFGDLIRKKPKKGLLGKLVSANEREKFLSEEQMISIAIFLFIAGEETTANSIGTALHDFIGTNNYQQLRSNPNLLRTTALEEFFRYDGPVHLLGRISKKETVIGNITIPMNSPLTLVIAAANRDEEEFQNAGTLKIDRTPNQHLAFGYGTHFCLGEWLGKLQTRIAVEKFISKFRSAKVGQQNIAWQKNIAVKGMTSLIVNTEE
ncbi:MAG: cytochrome P450 [Bacteroidota bacterium]